MLENPEWSWDTAIEFVRRVREIRPAPGIKESILEYVEAKRMNQSSS